MIPRIKPPQYLFFCALLLLITQIAYSQENSKHKCSQAYFAALQLYKESVKNQELLYNGSQYKPMEGLMRGHPYFPEEIIEGGTITYDDIVFTNVTMRYDIVNDKLIVHHVDQQGLSELLELQSEKVNSFQIANFHFVYVAKSQYENLDAGFYIPLHQGKSILFKKIVKEDQQEIQEFKEITYFNEKIKYYLVYNGVANRVRGKRSLLKIFKKDRGQLKSYIQKSDLKFKDEEESDFIKLLKYYDQIKE